MAKRQARRHTSRKTGASRPAKAVPGLSVFAADDVSAGDVLPAGLPEPYRDMPEPVREMMAHLSDQDLLPFIRLAFLTKQLARADALPSELAEYRKEIKAIQKRYLHLTTRGRPRKVLSDPLLLNWLRVSATKVQQELVALRQSAPLVNQTAEIRDAIGKAFQTFPLIGKQRTLDEEVIARIVKSDKPPRALAMAMVAAVADVKLNRLEAAIKRAPTGSPLVIQVISDLTKQGGSQPPQQT